MNEGTNQVQCGECEGHYDNVYSVVEVDGPGDAYVTKWTGRGWPRCERCAGQQAWELNGEVVGKEVRFV